jgi:hypothetical protein
VYLSIHFPSQQLLDANMSFTILTVFLALQAVTAAPYNHRKNKAARGISCPTADATTYTSGDKSFKIECGIDHLAGDMPAPNGQKAADLQACIQQCVAREGCTAVAFADKWACYLKSSVGAATPKSNVWGALLVTGSTPAPAASAPAAEVPAASAPAASAPAASAPAASSPVASAPADIVPEPVAAAPIISQASNAKATSAAAPKSTPTTTPAGGASGGSCARPAAKSGSTKRGVAYNDPKVVSSFGSAVSWAYNWGSTAGGSLPSGVTYIPMLWSPDKAGPWAQDAAAGIAAGADTLLSFNEPDHPQQANLDVATAATDYKKYMHPYACQARLGAPAVTNGGSPMGLTYLSNFMKACSDCIIDIVPIHWYDSATNIDYFKSYVAQAYAAGGNRPIWITEFGASGSDDQVIAFFNAVSCLDVRLAPSLTNVITGSTLVG